MIILLMTITTTNLPLYKVNEIQHRAFILVIRKK